MAKKPPADGAKPPRKKKIKEILKGFCYTFAVASDDEYGTNVVKAMKGIDPSTDDTYKPDETYSVTNDTCNCTAAEYGNECRHVLMVQGRLRGNECPREVAAAIVERFVASFKEVAGTRWTVIGGLGYGALPTVKRADILVFSPGGVSRETIQYAEAEGLLFRLIFIPNEDAYERRIEKTRTKWAEDAAKKAKKKTKKDE